VTFTIVVIVIYYTIVSISETHQYSDSIWRYFETCAGKKHVLAAASPKSSKIYEKSADEMIC
jgi:hypothetical protein